MKWIFAGDFNMIENKFDKQGGLKHLWKGNEKFFWLNFKMFLNLSDPIENRKGDYKDIWFTWNNNQDGQKRVFYRLDRVYLDGEFFSCLNNNGHSPIIVTPATISDHSC